MRNSQPRSGPVGANRPEFADGAFEAVLDKIVGAIGIARQRAAGIAPQSRNTGLDLVQEFHLSRRPDQL